MRRTDGNHYESDGTLEAIAPYPVDIGKPSVLSHDYSLGPSKDDLRNLNGSLLRMYQTVDNAPTDTQAKIRQVKTYLEDSVRIGEMLSIEKLRIALKMGPSEFTKARIGDLGEELASEIEQVINVILAQDTELSQRRLTDNATYIYRTKAVYGMSENPAPVERKQTLKDKIGTKETLESAIKARINLLPSDIGNTNDQ